MLEIATYGLRRRLKGALALSGLFALLAAMIVAFFPTIEASGADWEAYIESLPPVFREAFGVEAITTLGGFLAAELYQFAWVILLALYFAYRGGGLLAGDVERGRMDVLLATPVSRTRVVVEKYLSLSVPLVVVNVTTFLVVVAGVVLIDEPVPVADLAAVHLLSVPYLLACGAVGLVLSAAVHRADTARRAGLGLIFALFLVESVAASTDYAWLGLASPTRYYDPTAILVHGEYDLVGAAVLVAAGAVLVAAAVGYFRRVDIE